MKNYMKEHTHLDIKFPIKGLLIAVFIFFTSCKSHKTTNSGTIDKQQINNLELVIENSYSGTNLEENIVIRDAKTLNKFFSQVNKTRKPGIPVPQIDFAKETLILICSGKSTAGYMPEVLDMNEGIEYISLKIKKESQSKSNSTAVTTPFRLYKIPFTQKEILFE